MLTNESVIWADFETIAVNRYWFVLMISNKINSSSLINSAQMQPLEVPETLSRFNTAPERDQQAKAQPDFDWLLDKAEDTSTVMKSDVKEEFSTKWKIWETGKLHKTKASSNFDNKTMSTEQPENEEKSKVTANAAVSSISNQVPLFNNQLLTFASCVPQKNAQTLMTIPIQKIEQGHARLNSDLVSIPFVPVGTTTRYSPSIGGRCEHVTEIVGQLKQIESQYHTAKLNLLLSALQGSVSRTIDMLREISEKKENDDEA